MAGMDKTLLDFDPEIYKIIEAERQRQEDHVDLIASENYTSPAVLHAQGSVLTNKYAEGYAGKRYYGGCEQVDRAEKIAVARAMTLFNADYANVQPHSGSQANAAVYLALLQAGDTILGMSLDSGGHLTHGAAVSFSGRTYNAIHYKVDPETGVLDYEQIQALALQHKPKMLIAGFSAYSRFVDWQKFRVIADSVGAFLLIDMAHVSGLVATGLYPNPVPHADVVTSTTHKTLAGPRGGLILARKDSKIHKKLNFSLFPGLQGGPMMHTIAAKAVCFREAMSADFHVYQQRILSNARILAATIKARGYKVVTGGTDNHMFLLDLQAQDITGKDAEKALGQAHITVNKNAVPGDKRSPFITSGLRIGAAAIARREFGESESLQVAQWMCDILADINNEGLLLKIKDQVCELCKQLPIYSWE